MNTGYPIFVASNRLQDSHQPAAGKVLLNVNRSQGPFGVTVDGLTSGAERLECEKVVRLVPGKRVVCTAHWQGHQVFAKLYIGRGAERYWRRELRGLCALGRHQIPSPRILHQGTMNAGSGYLVLLEAIPAGRSFLQDWNDTSGTETRRERLFRLVDRVALQHQHGLEHRDPHFENFLLTKDQLYSLDGADIVCFPAPLSADRSIKNIALALAQLAPQFGYLIRKAYTHYCRQRAWEPDENQYTRLKKSIEAQRNKRRERYLHKVFRECTEYVCSKSYNRLVLFGRRYESPALERLLADPDASIQDKDVQIIKAGNTCTVWSIPVDGRRLVVKRYNLKDRVHAINRALRRTRAAVSWKNAHRLLFYGITTAAPVALVEERHGPLRGRAYYIAESVEGQDCVQRLRSMEKEPEQIQDVMKKIAALIADLAALGISHGDMKGTNILLQDGQPVLVDLDALRQYGIRKLFVHKHRRDLQRFLQNWEDQPALRAQISEALSKAGLRVD